MQSRPDGHISAGGVEQDVKFLPAEPEIEEAVDDAYRTKYSQYPRYVEPMVSADARATTLKLSRRGEDVR